MSVLGVDVQQALAAQRPVDVDRAAAAGDAVLGQRHDGRAARRAPASSSGPSTASSAGRGRRGRGSDGAVPLEVVVEVRDVHQGQVGVAARHDVLRRRRQIHARRGEPGARAPVAEQRERAERRGEFVVQVGRIGVAVRVLAAVGVVDRARGDRPVDVGAHRVPPADVGHRVAGVRAAGGVPQLVAAHERVVLPPQQDLARGRGSTSRCRRCRARAAARR